MSERNCIEIVGRLIEAKLIEVIYTIDGKEYLTPQELGKEIREELQVHDGKYYSQHYAILEHNSKCYIQNN